MPYYNVVYAIPGSVVQFEQAMNSESIPRNDVTTIFLLRRKIGSALWDGMREAVRADL